MRPFVVVIVTIVAAFAAVVISRQGTMRIGTSFLLAAYDGPIYQPRTSPTQLRRIDIHATIKALTAAGVNTYAYLICPDQGGSPRVTQSQLDDLPAFAVAASHAGIEVLVYLVPPTEADQASYSPFGWDYIQWASAIGKLARINPVIRGVVIDDFGGNVALRPGFFNFTPDYVKSMMTAARISAPWLSFSPILYHHDIVGPRAIASDYLDLASFVIFAYHGSSDGKTTPGNTSDASMALTQGREIGRFLQCQFSGCSTPIVRSVPLVFMTYAIPLQREGGRGASPSYLAAVLGAVEILKAENLVAGSMIFKLPLDPHSAGDRAKYDLVATTYARWRIS